LLGHKFTYLLTVTIAGSTWRAPAACCSDVPPDSQEGTCQHSAPTTDHRGPQGGAGVYQYTTSMSFSRAFLSACYFNTRTTLNWDFSLNVLTAIFQVNPS